MQPDDHRPAAGGHGEAARRKVVNAAADLMRSSLPVFDGGPLHHYLALLQDRLPVYVRVMKDLDAQVGRGDVAQNLIAIARATIGFYSDTLAAKVSVCAQPDLLYQLRGIMRTRGIRPEAAHDTVASYLGKEQRLGRVATEVDCQATARLLIGACLEYAFNRMVSGEGSPDEAYAKEIVHGLRLTP